MPTHDIPPPIFVLAPPGLPGQTLAAALGQNPAAYDLPELNLELMAVVDVLQRELTGMRATQMHGLLRAVAHLLSGEQTAASVDMARRWLNRRGYLPTAAVAQELAALVAPRRLVAPVTAAIFDAQSLHRLLAAFPDATFLRLHLHPHVYGRLLLAGTAGQVAIQLTGSIDELVSPPLPDPQVLWQMVETALSTFLLAVPAKQVRWQGVGALAADPAGALAALAASLDLPADAAAVAAMGHPEASAFAGPGPMGAHLPGQVQSFAALAAALPQADGASLSGPLPWRPDGVGFRDEVRLHAERLGYR